LVNTKLGPDVAVTVAVALACGLAVAAGVVDKDMGAVALDVAGSGDAVGVGVALEPGTGVAGRRRLILGDEAKTVDAQGSGTVRNQLEADRGGVCLRLRGRRHRERRVLLTGLYAYRDGDPALIAEGMAEAQPDSDRRARRDLSPAGERVFGGR
jgi:hypothetical protein